MIKRLLLFSFYLLFIAQTGVSQKKVTVAFDSNRHNFGDIKEEKGKTVEYNFMFTNSGSDTLHLFNVKAGCKAITTEWSKGYITSGKKGYVKVIYNPENQSGTFKKVVSVRTNDTDFPVKNLLVEGKVIPRKKTYLDFYPEKIGNLRFKKTHLAIDKFKHHEVRLDSLKIYNDWTKPIKFDFSEMPDFINCVAKPKSLKPGKEGLIIISYSAEKSKNWGLKVNSFNLLTNDSLIPKKEFTIGVNIVEDFSLLTVEKLANPPIIAFNKKLLDFGKVKQGDKAFFVFQIRNDGKRELVIRTTKTSCGCTDSKPENSKLQPGESCKLKVSFNTHGFLGKQEKTVTIISNDPKNPVTLLKIQATVVEL